MKFLFKVLWDGYLKYRTKVKFKLFIGTPGCLIKIWNNPVQYRIYVIFKL